MFSSLWTTDPLVREKDLRDGERVVDWHEPTDAGLTFIGVIHTPWMTRMDCPRQGRHDGPLCRIVLDELWADALVGLDQYAQVEVLYWLDRSRRDLLLQSPRDDRSTRGTFSLRSPIRPNPIATSIVKLEAIERNVLLVRGLDCLDGTPLLDLKPDRCLFTPVAPMAPPTRGDSDVGDP